MLTFDCSKLVRGKREVRFSPHCGVEIWSTSKPPDVKESYYLGHMPQLPLLLIIAAFFAVSKLVKNKIVQGGASSAVCRGTQYFQKGRQFPTEQHQSLLPTSPFSIFNKHYKIT